MALPAGTRIGPYEVSGVLGAGGMGEVYRARDPKLNRDVAIKVLPEVFAADADRLARFTREARVLASLNHPNIAAIYGVEESHNVRALVMELVEGHDLSAETARGPMAVTEALAIARQIADALEAAHDQGLVHRDLKPANVKVRADGTVKVLDFGLAKATDPADATSSSAMNSPTMTARMTEMGMILGTAAYMSPEQARGRAVDKRTDVWAFGCVLYEMLSGKRAFDGEDATEIISAVVKTEPDWSALPASVPPHVRTVITRCLVKDRKTRIPDLSVVRYVLDDTNSSGTAGPVAPSAPMQSLRVWQAATAALLLALAAGGVWWWYRPHVIAPPVAKFMISPPDGLVFTAGSRANLTVPAISPDGRTVAFTAQDATDKRMLWVRAIDSLTAQPLAGTEGASYPFWSPDSRYIGYAIVEKLMKVPAIGGPSTQLCSLNKGIISRGGTWNRDGVIVFNNGPAPLYRVNSTGGDATVLGTLTTGTGGQEFPSFLPDGRHFLYHAAGSADKGGVYIGSLDGGDVRRVTSASTGAIYDSNSGDLLFVRQGTLIAQRFDPKTFALSGDAFPVAEKVEASVIPGLVTFSISDTGTLAYGVGEPAGMGSQLTWVDRTGKVISTFGPLARYAGISLSPDDLQVAAHRHDDDGGDIWVTDVSRDSTSRFTSDGTQENASPVWSVDGKRLAFSSNRNGKIGIYIRSSDGSGNDERVFESSTPRYIAPVSWSPDGLSLLFEMPGVQASDDLWLVQLTGEHKATPVLQSSFQETLGQISPDGRWLAYMSTETGSREVYVRPVAGGAKSKVSTGGGMMPRWRGDSRELFFVNGAKMWAVAVTTKGAAFMPGTPTLLFDRSGTNNLGHFPYFSYAVTKDGQRFLIPRTSSGVEGPAPVSPIVVVLNWLEAIKK